MSLDELYKEILLDHYKNPRKYGRLKNYTVSARESNVSCGDKITVYLIIREDKISDISFTGEGCVLSIASASIFLPKLIGKSIKEVLSMKPEDIYKMVGFEPLPGRVKCVLLSYKTVVKGLVKYLKRNKEDVD